MLEGCRQLLKDIRSVRDEGQVLSLHLFPLPALANSGNFRSQVCFRMPPTVVEELLQVIQQVVATIGLCHAGLHWWQRCRLAGVVFTFQLLPPCLFDCRSHPREITRSQNGTVQSAAALLAHHMLEGCRQLLKDIRSVRDEGQVLSLHLFPLPALANSGNFRSQVCFRMPPTVVEELLQVIQQVVATVSLHPFRRIPLPGLLDGCPDLCEVRRPGGCCLRNDAFCFRPHGL